MNSNHNELANDFAKVFDFMAQLYRANQVFRWQTVPFIDASPPNDSPASESVAGHQWACVAMYYTLLKLMPATAMLIDSTKVIELLTFHDIAEISAGDTPLISQLDKGQEDKNQIEKEKLNNLTQPLPPTLKVWVDNLFQQYNMPEKQLESAIAQYINALQGNHFALVYGRNLSSHSQLISKIVTTFFIPLADNLIQLIGTESPEAATEWQTLTEVHLEHILQANIALDIDKQ